MFGRMLNPIGKRRRKSILVRTLMALGPLAIVAAIILAPSALPTAHANGIDGCAPSPASACVVQTRTAQANFRGVSGTTCPLDTYASVVATRTVQHPGDTVSDELNVLIIESDCNGLVEHAHNTDFTGTIRFAGVTTSTVRGAATMVDTISGASFTTTIDLTWQGSGTTMSGSSTSQTTVGNVIITTNDRISTRFASVSGALTNADGFNLASLSVLAFHASLNSDTTVTTVTPNT